MEDKSETVTLLERIAIALERIADSINLKNEKLLHGSIIEPAEILTDTDADETEPEQNNLIKLESYLNSRGISIKFIPADEESDVTLDKIALFIGNKLDHVKGVLDNIKGNMNSGKGFSMNFRNQPQQTVSDTTNLCLQLNQIAFLTSYHYQNSPVYQLNASPSTSPKAQNFFSGQWLERFVKTQVVSLLKSKSLEFSFICNAQISLPNGDDFELDMLFETEGEIFWLEAKSGEYQRHIEKYSKISKTIGLDCNHTIMVLADNAVTDNLAADLSSLYKMTVIRVGTFSEQLQRMLPNNPIEI